MALEIIRTTVFDTWLRDLRDRRGAMKISQRIERIRDGNFGDHKAVGGGLSELRLKGSGPGYRVYYILRKTTVIILLCGGDKDSQEGDISLAHEIAQEIP